MRSLVALTAALVVASALGQTYRWVDKEGHVHYTQTPPPPQAAKSVQKKELSGSVVPGAELPYATRVAAKSAPVSLYTSPDCGAACDEARALLVKRSVPFREISVTGAKEIDDLKKLTGKLQVPVLVVGSRVQIGYEEGTYQSALDAAGYPASGPALPLEALRQLQPPSAPATQGAPAPAAPAPQAR